MVLVEFGIKFFGYPFDNPMHRKWEELLKKHNRLCIQSWRESYKTSFFSVNYPAFKIYQAFKKDEEVRGALFSNTQVLANRRLDRLVDAMINTPLKILLPDRPKDRNNRSELKVQGKYSIDAISLSSSARGSHYHFVIVDDPLTETKPNEHEKIREYYFGTISNMVAPESKLVLIGTPLSTSDIFHDERIANNPIYGFYKFPAIKDDGAPQWDKWDLNKLEFKKKEIGELMFEREYQLRPFDDLSQSFFPYSLTKYAFIDKTKNKNYDLSAPKGRTYAVDPAFSRDGDYLAIVGGFQEMQNSDEKYIIDFIYRDQGLSSNQLIELLKDLPYSESSNFIIEKNICSPFIKDLYNSGLSLRLPVMNRKYKIDIFMKKLRSAFEEKKIQFISSNPNDYYLFNELLKELNSFGIDKKGSLKALKGHDDLAVALALLIDGFELNSQSWFYSK